MTRLASTRQMMANNQESDDEDISSSLGNKSAAWKYFIDGSPEKVDAIYYK